MYCSDNEAPARGKYVAPLTRESVIRYELSCLALVALFLGACQKETDKNTPPAAGKACLPEIVAEVEQDIHLDASLRKRPKEGYFEQ